MDELELEDRVVALELVELLDGPVLDRVVVEDEEVPVEVLSDPEAVELAVVAVPEDPAVDAAEVVELESVEPVATGLDVPELLEVDLGLRCTPFTPAGF